MSLENLGEKISDSLQVNEFATLPSIKGSQFGRDIYSSTIKFKDLRKFLETFPSVQREISMRKVKSIKRYILSGLENESPVSIMRFFSSITVSCRGTMFYDDIQKQVAIDVFNSKLSVNDGQHRMEGICLALDELENIYINSKDKEYSEKIRRRLETLENMAIPIVIFNGLNEREEKQLFHDLNNLAQRPSRSVNILLNQTDLYSKLSREVAEENRYISQYGVEYDKMSLHKNNSNSILLTTIYASIKELYTYERRFNTTFLNRDNYPDIKFATMTTFDRIFYSLPADFSTKGKYLLEKSYALRGICKFINDVKNDRIEGLDMNKGDIYKVIASIDWTYNESFWKPYGGTLTRKGTLVFGGGTSGGYRAVIDALIAHAKDESITAKDVDEIKEEYQDAKVG